MKVRQFRVQETRREAPPVELPRVQYDELFASLRYPLIWSYDQLCEGWLPAESDWSFIDWVNRLPPTLPELPEARVRQLRRTGLLEREADRTELQGKFASEGYVVLPLLDPELAKNFYLSYYFRQGHLHRRFKDPLPGISRSSVNNLPLVRLLHQTLLPLISSLVPEQIKTSYSFTAAYDRGSRLPKHTDRPQCVYNISLLLGSLPYSGQLTQWPLKLQRGEKIHEIKLDAGEGVLYSGIRDPHWRDPMPAGLDAVLGTFLHYVPASFSGSLD